MTQPTVGSVQAEISALTAELEVKRQLLAQLKVNSRKVLPTITVKSLGTGAIMVINSDQFDPDLHDLVDGKPEIGEDVAVEWLISANEDGAIVYWNGDSFQPEKSDGKRYSDDSTASSAISRTRAIQGAIASGQIDSVQPVEA